MLARRAARELTLILFSQINNDIQKYSTKEFNQIIVDSVRTLSNNAYDELKVATGYIVEMKEYIDNYECNHPTNTSRPIESDNLPVPIPLTSDMEGRLSDIEDVCEKAFAVLEVAEMTALSENSETKNYIHKVIKFYTKNHSRIDEEIKKHSEGWDFSRLVKTDKDILRIAITELLYMTETPMKVVADEAIELAKKYSTEDSASFINAILAKIIRENGLN